MWCSEERAPVKGALRRLLMQGRIASGVVKQCEDAGVAGKTIGNLKKCYVVAMTAGEQFQPDNVAVEGDHFFHV